MEDLIIILRPKVLVARLMVLYFSLLLLPRQSCGYNECELSVPFFHFSLQAPSIRI
jgi:hypothetical protein